MCCDFLPLPRDGRELTDSSLLHIKKLQDFDESDIDLSYLVGDVFRDKDVVKVIQSPPERESSLAPQSALRPHIPGVPARRRYVENGRISGKPAGLSSEAARQLLQSQYAPIARDFLDDVDGFQRPHKRQRLQERSEEPKHAAFDLNRPVPTREHVSPELGGQEPSTMLREVPSSLSLIEDSQRSRDVPGSHHREDYGRVSLNQLTRDAWTVPDTHMSPPPPWQNHNSAAQQPIRDEDIESTKSESSNGSKVLHSVPRSTLKSHPGESATRVTQETDVVAPSLYQPTIPPKVYKPIPVQSNGNHERSVSTASTTPLPPNQLTLMSRTRSEKSIQPYPVPRTSDISPQVAGLKGLAPTSDHVVLNPMETQVKLSQTFRSPSLQTSPSASDVDMLAEVVQVPSTAEAFVEVNPLQRPMTSKEHQISQRPDTAMPSGPLSGATSSDRNRAIDGKKPLITRAKRSAPSTKLEMGPSKTRKTKLNKVDEDDVPETVSRVGSEQVASAHRDQSHEGNRKNAAPLLGALQSHFRREKTLSVEDKENTLQSLAMPPTDTKPIHGNSKEGKKLPGIPLYPRPLSMHRATPARPAKEGIAAVLTTPPALHDVGIEAQMPLPPSLRRSVSFACEDPTSAQKPPASPKACQDASKVVPPSVKRSSKAARGDKAHLTLGPFLRSASPVAYGKPFVSPGNPVTVIPTIGQERKVYPFRMSAEAPEKVPERAESSATYCAPKLCSDAVKRKRMPPVTGTKPATVMDGDSNDAMATRTSTTGVSIIISSDDEKSVSSYYSSDSDAENPEKTGQIGNTMIDAGVSPPLTSKSADSIVGLEPSATIAAAAIGVMTASPVKEERASRSASASASMSPSKDYTTSRSPARYMSNSPLRSRSMEVPASEDEDEDYGQHVGSRLSSGSPKLPGMRSPSPAAISEVDVIMREDSAVSDEADTSSDSSTDNDDDEDERAASIDLSAPSMREVSKPPVSQSQAPAKDPSSLPQNANQGGQVASHPRQIQAPPSSSISAAPPTRPHAASRFPSLTALIGTNNSLQHDDSSTRASPRPPQKTDSRVTNSSTKLQYRENTSTTPSASHRSLENRALSMTHDSERDGNQASDSENSTSSSSMSDDDDAEEGEDEEVANLPSRHPTFSLSRGQQMIEVPPSSTKGKGRLSRLFTSKLSFLPFLTLITTLD